MSEIKLNEWRWGVVPELHDYASIKLGGIGGGPVQTLRPIEYHHLGETDRHYTQWYAVLSFGPPVMPEPELRLPEGWEIADDCALSNCWMLGVEKRSYCGDIRAKLSALEASRQECVKSINRILGGGK